MQKLTLLMVLLVCGQINIYGASQRALTETEMASVLGGVMEYNTRCGKQSDCPAAGNPPQCSTYTNSQSCNEAPTYKQCDVPDGHWLDCEAAKSTTGCIEENQEDGEGGPCGNQDSSWCEWDPDKGECIDVGECGQGPCKLNCTEAGEEGGGEGE